MSKKIYDILPPKLINKVEDTLKDLSGAAKKKKSHRKTVQERHKKRPFPSKEILIGGLVIVFLLGIYFYNKLPRVDIQIWPKTDNLTLQEKITADKAIDNIDLLGKIIPAQYIEQVEDSWQEFPATGIVPNDSKASGTIRIYNKISPSAPLTLKTGTHFLSDSGKYFVTLEKITIPGSQKKVPGSIEAKVQAKESGADYNIGPSKFSVPKLSGTDYYYSIWAESDKAMVGGYTGSLKKVTKDDISKAEGALTKKLLSQAENSLKNKLSQDDILLDGAISREVIEASSNIKTDSIIDKFNQSAKVKVSALVFKKQDLEKLAKDNILSQLSEDKSFLESSLNLTHNLDVVDLKDGKGKINLQISAKTYYDIDNNNLVDSVSKKSAGGIKEVIDEKYGDKISDIKINFWPLWVNKAPKNKNRIRINLIFE